MNNIDLEFLVSGGFWSEKRDNVPFRGRNLYCPIKVWLKGNVAYPEEGTAELNEIVFLEEKNHVVLESS